MELFQSDRPPNVVRHLRPRSDGRVARLHLYPSNQALIGRRSGEAREWGLHSLFGQCPSTHRCRARYPSSATLRCEYSKYVAVERHCTERECTFGGFWKTTFLSLLRSFMLISCSSVHALLQYTLDSWTKECAKSTEAALERE